MTTGSFAVKAFKGKVAVVTGAGSGIGRALALGLSRRGARLALADIDEAGLDETARLCETVESAPYLQSLDVSDGEAVETFAKAVAAHYGTVHQVFNNAGVGLGLSVLESSYEDYRRIFSVNLWGVIHGTKAFLPLLIASGDGHVINIASLNSFMAYPNISHYCTSKFAVRGFTESLSMEMLSAGHPVGVSVVCPGGVRTNITANSQKFSQRTRTAAELEAARKYDEKLLTLSPDRAAKTILDGVARRRFRILVGRDAWLVDKGVRVFPSMYPKLVVALSKRLVGGKPSPQSTGARA